MGGNLEDRNQVNIVNIYLGVKAFSWIEKGNYDHRFTYAVNLCQMHESIEGMY